MGTAAGLARGVRFRARAQAGDLLALSRRDPIAFQGAHRAWAGALAQAGVGIADLDLVETHYCFTTAEMIEYEAMGLAEPGEGHRVIREGVASYLPDIDPEETSEISTVYWPGTTPSV